MKTGQRIICRVGISMMRVKSKLLVESDLGQRAKGMDKGTMQAKGTPFQLTREREGWELSMMKTDTNSLDCGSDEKT